MIGSSAGDTREAGRSALSSTLSPLPARADAIRGQKILGMARTRVQSL
jgi:hypothetical protein